MRFLPFKKNTHPTCPAMSNNNPISLIRTTFTQITINSRKKVYKTTT